MAGFSTPQVLTLIGRDSRELLLNSLLALTPALVLSALLVHRVLSLLNFPILPVPDILWNAFVYLIPSRLILSLTPSNDVPLRTEESPVQHATKSRLLRNFLGLDTLDDAKAQTRRHFRNGPAGLGNWDNSCYQNSILQALASLESFSSFLKAGQCETTTEQAVPSTVQTLLRLVESLNDKNNTGKRLWTPATLKSMSSWQQQDAQEYFSKIVESVEKDMAARLTLMNMQQHSLNLVTMPPASKQTLHNSSDMLLQRDSIKIRTVKAVQESALDGPIISNPLEGLLAQRVGCTRCGHVDGISAIPFNCITLPLGNKLSYNLGDRLNEFTALDLIEGVECGYCTLLQAQSKVRSLLENVATDASKIPPGVDWTSHGEYQASLQKRESAINAALMEKDFSEGTLSNKCGITGRFRVSTAKSRQAVILRPPNCLVLHLNRSIFDEVSGAQLKNYAEVTYNDFLDISPWCLGSDSGAPDRDFQHYSETWELDPGSSMLKNWTKSDATPGSQYRLQAVITHHGRHENGHYVCYKRFGNSPNSQRAERHIVTSSKMEAATPDQEIFWWRISDDNVKLTTAHEALTQAGAFMLFYERVSVPSKERGILNNHHDSSPERWLHEHRQESGSEQGQVEKSATPIIQVDDNNNDNKDNKNTKSMDYSKMPDATKNKRSKTTIVTDAQRWCLPPEAKTVGNSGASATNVFGYSTMWTANPSDIASDRKLSFQGLTMVATT